MPTVIDFQPTQPLTVRAAARPDTLQSVSTALDVLDCFVSAQELGVSEIARRLGIAKSSAHRLLTTLAARQIVEKNPDTGHYRLGVHLFALGHLAQSRMSLSALALPELQRMHGATGHTVFVGMLDGESAIYPHFVGNPAISAQLAKEATLKRAHATALGRAMAALDPALEQKLRQQAHNSGPAPYAARAVNDFDKAIMGYRRSGVAASRDSVTPGLSGLAAPIRTLSGRPVAALVVAGPTTAVVSGADRISRLLPAAAARVSRLVGTG